MTAGLGIPVTLTSSLTWLPCLTVELCSLWTKLGGAVSAAETHTASRGQRSDVRHGFSLISFVFPLRQVMLQQLLLYWVSLVSVTGLSRRINLETTHTHTQTGSASRVMLKLRRFIG